MSSLDFSPNVIDLTPDYAYSEPTKPLNVLICGDLHFKTSNVQVMSELTSKFLALIPMVKPDLIVMLGDTLDSHEKVDLLCLKSAIKFLWEVSRLVPTILIVGNHDRPNNSDFLSDTHAFTALKSWSNTVVVDTTKIIRINGYTFFAVPYVFPGRFEEALLTVNTNTEGAPNYRDATAIFSHQEYFGAKMGAISSRIGDVWPTNYPLNISGHIHDYDELQTNLIYVGTGYMISYGCADGKTVSQFIWHPNKAFDHKRHDLQVTRKRIVYITPQEALTYEPPERCQVKLVIRGTGPEIKGIIKCEHLQELAKRGVKIAYKYSEDVESQPQTTTDTQIQAKSYLRQLYTEILPDLEQVKWFEKLFGRPKSLLTLKINS